MICEPFYGHMSINIDWIPHDMSWKKEEDRTMGVRIINGGNIQCLFYPPFVAKLPIEQLYGVIQHELEHLVRCHCVRIGERDKLRWNIAADMSVNGKRSNPRIGYKNNKGDIVLPLNGNMVWIPEDWDADDTTETYYELLKNDVIENHGQILDDHDTWNQSDLSADEIRQVVKNLIEQAVEKSKGNTPDHVISAIKKLNKPIIRWRQLLRNYIGRHSGNTRYTYSRRNRRRRNFGIKGTSKHATSDINVIIDISGSINNNELQQFFTEIEAINYKCKIWLLQWDEQFRGYAKYRRGDWKKLKLHGRGGTDMSAPIKWLCDNGQVKGLQIMLTDGYCDYSSERHMNLISVITTNDQYTNIPDWGKVIMMDMIN